MSNPKFARLECRALIQIIGEDARTFLQGLVSSDVEKISAERAIYGAFLTPQGKYLHDFFATDIEQSLYLDCEASRIDDFYKRLRMYKLRSKVSLEITNAFQVFVIFGEGVLQPLGLPELPGAAKSFQGGIVYTDPRLSLAGARCILPRSAGDTFTKFGFSEAVKNDYDRHRISLGLPDSSRDMEVEKSILLENGFEELNGVDFNKGCYMGQELTARTKYRGLVKKRLMPVIIDGVVSSPGLVIFQNCKGVGELRSVCGDIGMALIRLEALEKDAPLTAGDARIVPKKPSWANF